jgi:hypothetical protein
MRDLYQRIIQVADMENPDIIHAHSPVLNGVKPQELKPD